MAVCTVAAAAAAARYRTAGRHCTVAENDMRAIVVQCSTSLFRAGELWWVYRELSRKVLLF